MTDEAKERRVNIDFEPFKPINTSLYLCDNKFHTEALDELLEDDEKFGFIVMDGNGSLYGTLQGNNREVLHKFSVDLPKKRGQKSVQFSSLCLDLGVGMVVEVSLHSDLRGFGWKSATIMYVKSQN
jgi:peptide chain release factor subunit 1